MQLHEVVDVFVAERFQKQPFGQADLRGVGDRRQVVGQLVG